MSASIWLISPQHCSKKIAEDGEHYGTNSSMEGKRVTIEFSCPNTNKPLHLGHMRNDSLGESVAALLKANGATVRKVNLINNRGVHICNSMLAYQKFGNGETPQSSNIKGDHLVGKYYVKFAQWAKEDPSAEEQAQQMLVKWEQGDEKTIALWKLMNGWTLDGLAESYEKMGISFDAYYYESETYKFGKDEILKGLEDGCSIGSGRLGVGRSRVHQARQEGSFAQGWYEPVHDTGCRDSHYASQGLAV